MLPTFVIGLREGLEAALIVGIIAAFLRQQGRKDLLRWVFVGVGVAVAICVAIGVALDVVNQDLPQRQQEGMETVIGFVAVGMVTYMVVWMKRHSRDLKGQLEGLASEAITGPSRSARAMIVMAFLAVLREGFETSVFLLAAYNESRQRFGAGTRRGARHRRRCRPRLRHLPRRRAAQPLEVLPSHRPGPGAGRRWPGRQRAAHRARGRLAPVRAGQHDRPDLAGPSGFGAGVAAHRHARRAAATGLDRVDRVAGLPRPGRPLRRLAARQGAGAPHHVARAARRRRRRSRSAIVAVLPAVMPAASARPLGGASAVRWS